MKRSSVLLVLLAAASGCSAPASRAALGPIPLRAPRAIRVGVVDGSGLAIRTVSLETYVQATAVSEFAPASGELEVVERMLEVQSVVGRTYALAHVGRHSREGFDLCATTHCQLYEPARLRTSRWAAAASEAAQQTSGAVLWYDGAPAKALFHADCGGHTSNSADVWGGPGRPYLIAMPDDGPAASAHTTWRFEASRDAVMRALNADPRTRVGARLDAIKILDRDSAGRAEHVALHAQQELIVRGDLLREVLAAALGVRSVRSTQFAVRRERGTFVFEGRGFGHGVGLCQAGALARIRAGARVPAILQRYFPGTKLVTLTAPGAGL